jgi:hypothetical protein
MVDEKDQERKRVRRSRWAPVDDGQVEVKDLRTRLDNITQAINTNTIPVNELCRSPSPEPRYDSRGKRVNTRGDRARDKLEAERHKLCARLKLLDSEFKPPSNMRPLKVVEKLYIPKEKEGTINFIGLILGPRGTTQKALEREFTCRVAIRGKGSVKDGRARGPATPDDDDKLHVVISAEGLDARERIERCKIKIKDIITPRADDENEHKQRQLRELARINGTLRDQDRDLINVAGRAIGESVSCTHCGSSTHPSSDCTNKTSGLDGSIGAGNATELDADYRSFMAELNGENPGLPSADHSSSVPQNTAQTRTARLPPPWLLPGAFATRSYGLPPPPSPVYGQGAASTLRASPPDVTSRPPVTVDATGHPVARTNLLNQDLQNEYAAQHSSSRWGPMETGMEGYRGTVVQPGSIKMTADDLLPPPPPSPTLPLHHYVPD